MSPSKLYTPMDHVADLNYFDPKVGGDLDASTIKDYYHDVHDKFTRKMTIHDVRNREYGFTLSKNGFQLVTLPKKERHETDPAKVEAEYYPEVEALLKQMTGADQVYVFVHRIRASLKTRTEGDSGERRFPGFGGPAAIVHTDFSANYEHQKTGAMSIPIPEEAKKLIENGARFFFIGVWKPIKAVQRDPLCFCDVNTVPASDYKTKIRMGNDGKIWSSCALSHAAEKDQHQWYYLNEMTPEDLCILAGYDTNHDEPGWRCPHNSFHIPGTEHLPPRESIECHAIAIWG